MLAEAKEQRISTAQKVAVYAAAVFTLFALTIPFFIPTILKPIVWNPIEYVTTGEIRTKSPLSWLQEQFIYFTDKYADDTTAFKIDTYKGWLTKAPVITNEHVNVLLKEGSFDFGALSHLFRYEVYMESLGDLKEYVKNKRDVIPSSVLRTLKTDVKFGALVTTS